MYGKIRFIFLISQNKPILNRKITILPFFFQNIFGEGPSRKYIIHKKYDSFKKFDV